MLGSIQSFQKQRLAFLERVARECGEIGSFRLGPIRTLLANSPSLIHAVLMENSATFVMGPRGKIATIVLGPNSLGALDGEAHRKQRRLNAPAFQHKRILGYSGHMTQFADEFQKSCRDGAEMDLAHELMHLSHRIIRKTLFDLGDSDGPEVEEFYAALDTAEHYAEYLAGTALPLPMWIPTARNRKTRPALATMRRFITNVIEERRRGGHDHGDFLSMLVMARDEEGATLNDEQVRDHVLMMYIAGHETSARSLTWAFLMLAKHPEILARLQKEVDTVLQGRLPTHEDLIRLPYTLQVIKETLRLYPTGYMTGRAPSKDIEVQGYLFRKDEYVLIAPYTLHRDPKTFPEPERFDPERFNSENEKRIPRGAYLPFGGGPHVCIGSQFAMMKMHLLLAHLAQNLTFSVVPGQDIHPVPVALLRPSSARMVVHRRAGAPRH